MSDPLDVLLINPGSHQEIYQSLANELTAIEPPVWTGLLASYARQKSLSVRILDANAEGLGPKAVAKLVAEMRPTLSAVVVYGHQPSASTQNMAASSAICSAIKEEMPEQKVILVGGHVAALPDRTMREEKTDFVCSGEGFLTLEGLVSALKSRHPNLSTVPDLWYRDGNEIRFTLPAALVKDVEREVPGIPWEMLPMGKYRAHNWHCFDTLERQPYASLYTTLGCPYHCSFCCIQAPFKSGEKAAGLKESQNSYRFWSPAVVGDWIERLVKDYGVRNIKFADEMFVLNDRHVMGICDEIIRRKLDVNIWAYARVDTVREGMVDKLKKAGFNWLAFGIEAANAKVRKDVQKGFDQEDIFRTLKRVREAGIYVIGNYIFGLPEDDHASMQETLDLAMELNCEFGNFYSAMAYPGSPLYLQALHEKWPLPEKWSGYSQHAYDTLPLPTKHLSAAEVLRFRDQAFMTYNTNPAYLKMIESRFGAATAQHVREMTKTQLRRRILETPAHA